MQHYPRNNPPPFTRLIFSGPGEYGVKLDMRVKTSYNGYYCDVPLERMPQQQTPPKEYPRHNNGWGSSYTLNGTTMYPRSSSSGKVTSSYNPRCSPPPIGLWDSSNGMDHSFNYTHFHERQRSPVPFDSDSSRFSSNTFNPTANKLGDYPATSTPIKQQPASLFRDKCSMM